jgi:hypothetical protein
LISILGLAAAEDTTPPASEATDAGVASIARDPVAFLRREGGLNATELGLLERGAIHAKVIETSDRSEVLVFAATRVKATADRALEVFRDIEGLKGQPWVMQIGRLGASPTPNDLVALTLEPGDVKHLSRCRVNNCDVRLPAEAIERFRREIDWSSAVHGARAEAMFRQLLATYAEAYLKRGNTALFEYANNDDPVRVSDSLDKLIGRSQFLQQAVPDVWTSLQRFPEARPADAEDIVYWLKERFWLLNVLSLNHVTIVDRATSSGRMVLAVTKQLYASHYYESSLSTTMFVEGPAGAGAYLIFVNRTRADIRRSGFTWVERLLLNHLVRGRLDAQLKFLRGQLEAGSGDTPPGNHRGREGKGRKKTAEVR